MSINLQKIIRDSKDRFDLWSKFINVQESKMIVEVGVYKGDFASQILKNCNSIEKYYMVDPWKNLENWNKPLNRSNEEFEEWFSETLKKTSFASNKTVILKGKTSEVINKINDESLDFAYIDGDHTLKGITIDLINIWAKVKMGSWIAGDDCMPSIWQHSKNYEPSLVFPYITYFAEAMGAELFLLPYDQFLLRKTNHGFKEVNLSGKTFKRNLRSQFFNESSPRSSNLLKSLFNFK